MKTAVATAEPDKPIRMLQLEDLLRRLVEAQDGGADTYDVRYLVEEARELLDLPPPPWRRRP